MASDPLGDTGFMRRAMALAREGDRKPGANPIGCVIDLDGAIIGEGYNEVDIRHDPTSPAEIVAMRRAGEKLRQTDPRRDALLDLATLWHVHDGVDLGQDRTHRIRGGARPGASDVFRGPAP